LIKYGENSWRIPECCCKKNSKRGKRIFAKNRGLLGLPRVLGRGTTNPGSKSGIS